MKCEDTAEFVSALYNGEEIPQSAAEHIGSCPNCLERLNSYSSIGNELRRLASLEPEPAAGMALWPQIRRTPSKWWKKGFTTMRIPRLAFATMLIGILFLSGGLVLVRARAGLNGPALQLTYLLPDGRKERIILTTGWNSRQTGVNYGLLGFPGLLTINTRLVAKDGDRTQLGIKSKYDPQYRGTELSYRQLELDDVPEQLIWIEPGQKPQISVSGLGKVELTGEYLDHIPPLLFQPNESLDPKQNEFRVVTPVLIRDKKVVVNLDGNSISCCSPDATLMLYVPGEGRYLISSVRFRGAIEGIVHLGHVDFILEGHKYLLLTSMPITRSERVWVTHEPDFKPSERMVRPEEARDDRPMFLVRNLDELQQPRIPHS